MGLAWELGRAEMRARPGTFAGLAFALALAVASGGATLALVEGVQDAITREVRATVTGDVRVTRGPTDLGGGLLDEGLARLPARVDDLGAHPGLRIEAEGLVSNGTAGVGGVGVLLVGIGDDDPLELDDRIVAGDGPRPRRVWVDGRPFVPVLVGTPLVRSLRLAVYPGDGTVEAGMRVNLTAGHLALAGGRLTPVALPGLVVGEYQTGFRTVDKAVVFVPIEAARELLGRHPDVPLGNVVVALTDRPGPVLGLARDEGYNATTARGFQREYLGPVYDAVIAFAVIAVGLLLAVGAAWIGTAIGTAIAHDARRLATLLAVGLPPALLRRSWLSAAAATAVAGAAAGVVAVAAAVLVVRTVSISAGAASALDILVPLQPLAVVGLAVAAVLVALLAARIALVRLDRMPVVETLKA